MEIWNPKKLGVVGLLLCTPLTHAQQDEEAVQDTLIQPKTVQMADTLEVVPQLTLVKGPEGDGVGSDLPRQYDLKDQEELARQDSLWLVELYNAFPFYDTIQTDIANLDVEKTYIVDLPTDTLKARLAKLDAKSPFNIGYNPSLENVIKSFLKRRGPFIERMLTASQFYFPLFEQELDAYNIPMELKYLAIVESALNPRARSRVGATGLWQFMYTTGMMYKLEVNSYVDERSDPIRATKAACAYMQKLYGIFEDWDLVLAAYNSGPGNVNKAIRRSGGYENYWNIRRNLPRETAGYVPAFLATMYLFEYAEEHGIVGAKADRAYFETDTIHVKHLITFDQVAELVNISKEELKVLNPAYKLDIIPYVEGKDYALRLPVSKIGAFVNNEKAIYAHVSDELKKREKPLPKFTKGSDRIRYRVRSGDYLGKIANRYRVRVSDIKRWNGLRSNNLRVGQRLTIYPRNPGAVAQAPAKKQASKKPVSLANVPPNKLYTVKDGDSLWTISKKYPGITVDNLQEWNGISGRNLKPGQKLKLCGGC
jgi:membrane-bound lytic murein transglycosylase D